MAPLRVRWTNAGAVLTRSLYAASFFSAEPHRQPAAPTEGSDLVFYSRRCHIHPSIMFSHWRQTPLLKPNCDATTGSGTPAISPVCTQMLVKKPHVAISCVHTAPVVAERLKEIIHAHYQYGQGSVSGRVEIIAPHYPRCVLQPINKSCVAISIFKTLYICQRTYEAQSACSKAIPYRCRLIYRLV